MENKFDTLMTCVVKDKPEPGLTITKKPIPSNLDNDEVKIEMSAPNRAGLIMPMDQDDEKEDMLMLVMPVMLNQ